MSEVETPDGDLDPLRSTIDATAVSARQAAERSGRVLELMSGGSVGYDPIEALGDAVFLIRDQLDRVEAKLDAMLTLLQSGTSSPPSAPTRPKHAETA